MRTVGAVLLIFAAAALGHLVAAQRERRARELEGLVHGIQLLETQIVYGMTLLPEALRRVGRASRECGGLFERAASEIAHGESASAAWNSALESWRSRSALAAWDTEPLEKLGPVLGLSGAEDQSRHLQLVRAELVVRLEEARKRLPEVTRLFRALGVCGGLALALLLI